MEKHKLEARNTRAARREASRRWPQNDVKLTGYSNGEAVYLSLVRNVTKGYVATATRGITPKSFVAEVVEQKKEGSVFNCALLDEYFATPIRKRTPEQRSAAYVESYDMLIDWWHGCLDRNYETPTLRSDRENRAINIPAYLKELEDRRNSFLL